MLISARRFFICVLALAGLCSCGDEAPTAHSQPTSITSLLGNQDADGFASAISLRDFTFPADHGAHPDYRTEWWYWTGNLTTADGRAFGYQFTIFRFALALAPAPARARTSAWAATDTWLAHLTLSDIAGQKFYAFERSARGALDLAGASSAPLRIHCDGWEVAGNPMHIQADAGDIAVDLTLELGKPVVLQGDRGLSRKGAAPDAASYYYSLTRMPTSGTLRLGERAFAVQGNSWMDREWSTSSLEPGVVGWDWFALHLADGRDVMLYRLRRSDGSATPFSGGSLVARDGSVTRLTADDFTINATATWTSRTGTTYPAAWHLRAADLDLVITPRIPDQELNLTVRYWEGAVAITGSQTGVGYVELAGYSETSDER